MRIQRRPSAIIAAAGLAALTLLGPANGPAGAVARSDRIQAGERLGQSESITSPNRQHTLMSNTKFTAMARLTGSCAPQVIGPTGPSREGGYLEMSADGDLALVSERSGQVWHSNTGGNPGAYAVLQDDRNFVVYSSAGKPLWASGTTCNTMTNMDDFSGPQAASLSRGQFMQSPNRKYRLALQSDGNLVLYGPTGVLMNVGTTHGQELQMSIPGNVSLVSGNSVLWQTNTEYVHPTNLTAPETRFVLQDDGNLVAYRWNGRSWAPLWSSGTAGR